MKHKAVNIQFTDDYGYPDETQFDFYDDWDEIASVWADFCKENNLDVNSLVSMDVVEIDEDGYEPID